MKNPKINPKLNEHCQNRPISEKGINLEAI